MPVGKTMLRENDKFPCCMIYARGLVFQMRVEKKSAVLRLTIVVMNAMIVLF